MYNVWWHPTELTANSSGGGWNRILSQVSPRVSFRFCFQSLRRIDSLEAGFAGPCEETRVSDFKGGTSSIQVRDIQGANRKADDFVSQGSQNTVGSHATVSHVKLPITRHGV